MTDEIIPNIVRTETDILKIIKPHVTPNSKVVCVILRVFIAIFVTGITYTHTIQIVTNA